MRFRGPPAPPSQVAQAPAAAQELENPAILTVDCLVSCVSGQVTLLNSLRNGASRRSRFHRTRRFVREHNAPWTQCDFGGAWDVNIGMLKSADAVQVS